MRGQPLDAARHATLGLVRELDLATNRVGLASFSDQARLDQALTHSYAEVEEAVQELRAGGETNIEAALLTATAALADDRRDSKPVLVLLSDGDADSSREATLAAADAAKRQGIQIITIGLGRANTALLQAIASSPDDYYYAPSPDVLQDRFDRIAQRLTCQPLP